MKLAIISPLNGIYSGAHKYAEELHQYFVYRDHDCDLLTFNRIGRVPIDAEIINTGKVQNTIFKLEKYDWIHFSTVSENSKEELSVFSPYYEFFNYSVTIHATNDLVNAPDWKNIVKHAKAIIFTCQPTLNYYLKEFPKIFDESKCHVIEMPYNIREYNQYTKKENLVINLSRFITVKHIREYFELATMVPEMEFVSLSRIFHKRGNKESFSLGMIGKSYYENISGKLSKNSRILCYSDFNRTEEEVKISYLERAKYLVDFTSFDPKYDADRVQYTILEAMNYGLIPIFTSNFFGKTLKEYINGFPANTPKEASIYFMDSPESLSKASNIISHGFTFLEEHYKDDSNYNEYNKLFLNCMEKHV